MSKETELSALDAALADLDALEGSDIDTSTSTDTTTVEAKGTDDDELAALEADLEEIENMPDISADLVNKGTKAKSEPAKKAATTKAKAPASKAKTAAKTKPTTSAKKPEVEAKEPVKDDAKAKGADDKPSTEEGAETSTAPKSRAHGAVRPSEALAVRLGGVDAISATMIHTPGDAELSADDLKKVIAERMTEIDTAPKKVGEKLVNAYAHLNNGTNLSVYTETALTMILEEGTLTSTSLFNKYREHPYSEGTARSQSGQLMKVLPLMGIAERDGQTLTLIEDSVLASVFREKLGIVESA